MSRMRLNGFECYRSITIEYDVSQHGIRINDNGQPVSVSFVQPRVASQFNVLSTDTSLLGIIIIWPSRYTIATHLYVYVIRIVESLILRHVRENLITNQDRERMRVVVHQRINIVNDTEPTVAVRVRCHVVSASALSVRNASRRKIVAD